MQFSQMSYKVKEGSDAKVNVAITLESIESNPEFGFTVLVHVQDGSATCETVIYTCFEIAKSVLLHTYVVRALKRVHLLAFGLIIGL